MKQQLQKFKKSQRGSITLDFVFALVLISGFSAVLFSLSISLVVVEITQFMTFAAARTYMAGHTSVEEQERLGLQKWDELKRDSELGVFFANGWFEFVDEQ